MLATARRRCRPGTPTRTPGPGTGARAGSPGHRGSRGPMTFSSCHGCSMPSAMVRRPRAAPRSTTARTSASPFGVSSPATKLPSIFRTSRGSPARAPSDDQPVPKSSMAKRRPRRAEGGHAVDELGALGQGTLGDLEDEPRRCQRRCDGGCRRPSSTAVGSWSWRTARLTDTQCSPPRSAAPPARLLEDPPADGDDAAGLLGEVEERRGRQQAPLGVAPAQQRPRGRRPRRCPGG